MHNEASNFPNVIGSTTTSEPLNRIHDTRNMCSHHFTCSFSSLSHAHINLTWNIFHVFQQLLSQLEAHGAEGALKTSSSAQNVAFVSQSKSNTNKVKSGFFGAYSSCTPSTSSTNVPEKEILAGFADEVIYSLFAKQTEDLDLLHEDLEQIDDVDIEEMDINWQIEMIAIRMKKFYKKTGRRVRREGKTPVGEDKKKALKREIYSLQHQEAGSKRRKQKVFATIDDEIVNWGDTLKLEETNHALMAISSTLRFTSPMKFKEVPQKPVISVSDENSSEHSSCQSNDSEGSCENISEQSFETESERVSEPNEVSNSREGLLFTKKKCFVCGSPQSLIKIVTIIKEQWLGKADDYGVVNTGDGWAKPVGQMQTD
ncbi:hypothetical protein Tco_0838502 [Tanacetum coccineum]|uniref:Uncharacterized protein n=1 Tax=Tanacetum coccineum TaxID=301880 RepID=A0ABQ5AMZ6_9ASTR